MRGISTCDVMNVPESLLTRAFLGAPPPEDTEAKVDARRKLQQLVRRNIFRLETDRKKIERDAVIALSNANREARKSNKFAAEQYFKTSVTLRRNAQYVQRVQGTLEVLSSQSTVHSSIQQTMKSFSKIAKQLTVANKRLKLDTISQTVIDFQKENDVLTQKMGQIQDSLNDVAENASGDMDDLSGSLSVDEEARELYEKAKDGACMELQAILSGKNTSNAVPPRVSREEIEFLRAAEAASKMPKAPSNPPGK